MKYILNLWGLFLMMSCNGQELEPKGKLNTEGKGKSSIDLYYENHLGDDEKSISKGSVSNGALENGKLVPFAGDNFQYFDTSSYLAGRVFTSDGVKKAVINTYSELGKLVPGRQFRVMECSNEHGGKLFPHKTHQNGLSVDFMMPLIKDGKPYYGLDDLGKDHYWLDFDNEGKYLKDKTISIDFDLVAQHILLLNENAQKVGLKVSKVIIKIELKNELYASKYGIKLKSSGIYIVKSLTPTINGLHDDHFHIDFKTIE